MNPKLKSFYRQIILGAFNKICIAVSGKKKNVRVFYCLPAVK